MLWPNSREICQWEGLLLLFSHQDVSNILKMKKNLQLEKMLELPSGGGGSVMGQKEWFLKLNPLIPISEFTDSFHSWEGNFVIFPNWKSYQTQILHQPCGFIAKFHLNLLMETLIFSIWVSEPIPGLVKRLKRLSLIELTDGKKLFFQSQNIFKKSSKIVTKF